MARTDFIVGVEVGTSKVCAVVAEAGRDGDLHILGVGVAPSRGVRKGEIIDLSIAVECVHDALAEAEANSEVEICDVAVAVSGAHIASFNSRGAVAIPTERLEIEEEDLQEVAIKAREVNIPPENTFLHSVIQHYYVDGQEGVINPVGLVGRRLEADFHIVHGVKTRLQNTLRCLEENGMHVEDVVVNSLASSQSVLSDHQREMGAVVIDIGGGVSDFIVFAHGVVRQSGVLAVGGDHISNDISLGLRIPLTRAERLKLEEGSAMLGQSRPGETITLKNDAGFSGKEIEREMLNMIIHARVAELFTLIHKQISAETPSHIIGGGVFLTGGGSLLRGIREVAESVFEVPVHLARDVGISGPKSILSDPKYATAIGVVKFMQARRSEQEPPSLLDSIFGRFRGVFKKG